jgi:hypothetical protein
VFGAQQAAREALVGATIATVMAGVGKDLRGELTET